MKSAAHKASKRCIENMLAPGAMRIGLQSRHGSIGNLLPSSVLKANGRSVCGRIVVLSRRTSVRFVKFRLQPSGTLRDEENAAIHGQIKRSSRSRSPLLLSQPPEPKGRADFRCFSSRCTASVRNHGLHMVRPGNSPSVCPRFAPTNACQGRQGVPVKIHTVPLGPVRQRSSVSSARAQFA